MDLTNLGDMSVETIRTNSREGQEANWQKNGFLH
jgi:hypothetical protein